MKLWLLRPIEGLDKNDDPWNPWYDKSFGFVIRAKTEERARELAADDCGDEGSDAWLNPKYSTCEELNKKGPELVIMRDFASA